MNRETLNDILQSVLDDDSDIGCDRRARFQHGCNQDDTRDSRGEPLRPTYNDAGEPYWM